MVDVSNRRREPKGTPDGGKFANELGGGADADDLDEQELPRPSISDDTGLANSRQTREALLDLARIFNAWNGGCEWADVFEQDDILAALGYQDLDSAARLMDAVANGDYNPMAEFYRLDGYGNLESLDERQLEDEAADNADDIIDTLKDTPEVRENYSDEDIEAMRDGDATLLLNAARDLNRWNGSCDWADTAETITDLFAEYGDGGDHDGDWLANRVYYGGWRPGRDYTRFNAYGNFESVNEDDLMDEAWDNRDEILDEARESHDDPDVDDARFRLEDE